MILRSKPDDVDYGVKIITRADGMADAREQAFELAPPYERMSVEFGHALGRAFDEGGWAVYIDEMWLAHRLGLERIIEKLVTQGRSKGITVIGGMQRPVGVSRFILSQAQHVLSFAQEGRDAKIIADATTAGLRDAIADLDRYQFVWYYRRERKYAAQTLQDLGGDI